MTELRLKLSLGLGLGRASIMASVLPAPAPLAPRETAAAVCAVSSWKCLQGIRLYDGGRPRFSQKGI